MSAGNDPPPLELAHAADLIGDLEAAQLSGVSRQTISFWRRSGLLPSIKVGGVSIYAREDVLRFAQDRAEGKHDGRRTRAVTA